VQAAAECHRCQTGYLQVNIGDWPLEPEPGVKHPGADAEQKHAADEDRRVVEIVLGDGVRHREGEEHGDEAHPGDGDPADEEAIFPEVKRPRNEGSPGGGHAEQDGQPVGYVRSDRGDGQHCLERHLAPQRLSG